MYDVDGKYVTYCILLFRSGLAHACHYLKDFEIKASSSLFLLQVVLFIFYDCLKSENRVIVIFCESATDFAYRKNKLAKNKEGSLNMLLWRLFAGNNIYFETSED